MLTTIVLPRLSPKALARWKVSSLVRKVRTISSSGITGTGCMKWSPNTCAGRLVAAAISVTAKDEVLLAKMA